jgi:transposase-like protein
MPSSHDDGRTRWKGLMADQHSSGLSVAEWCRVQGIRTNLFYYWRKRLSEVPSDSSVRFIPVSVVRDTALPGLTLRVGPASVRIEPGFDHRLLTELLDVLESRSC